jgi:hypothetical protein
MMAHDGATHWFPYTPSSINGILDILNTASVAKAAAAAI